MRLTSFLICLLLALAAPIATLAQPAAEASEESSEEVSEPDVGGDTVVEGETEEGDLEGGEAPPEESEPTLEPPTLSPLTTPPPVVEESASLEDGVAGEPELPDPAEAAALMEETEQHQGNGRRWTLPESVFSLHGYFRVRANVMRKLALGRSATNDRLSLSSDTGVARTNVDPFDAFRPTDSSVPTAGGGLDGNTVEGGCGKSAGSDGRCSRPLQISSDMRLRLKPEIALSDDVRLKMWVDVFDNVAFGTADRDPNQRIELRDTIKARRAWGEVRDRDLGELRFGRMGADWGLGILDNGGDRNGVDSDFSSDVDRIMGITNLGGFYIMGAYDWAAQGDFLPGASSPSGVPLDRAQKDDLSEITLAVSRRATPEEQQTKLAQGDAVFNAGLYFIWRKQLIQANSDSSGLPFERLGEKQFVPDLWMQLMWRGLRLEAEAAFVAGSLENGCPRLVAPGGGTAAQNRSAVGNDGVGELSGEEGGNCKLRQFGAALEAEYRLIDDRLGIRLYGGYASGDRHGYGLAATNDTSRQVVSSADRSGHDIAGTFGFHPDYRVDLILWRSIMRRVAGAYYFKPGVSFDFLRNPFGQRLGGAFDVIYSRASTARQTWGADSNLGVELDVSLYYRSEDGPDPLDGFYAQADAGVLFPLGGLQTAGVRGDGDPAIMFRSVLGIAF